MANVKMIKLSNNESQNELNIKLFHVRHSNDECQNDMKVKLFDIQHPNGNVKLQCSYNFLCAETCTFLL